MGSWERFVVAVGQRLPENHSSIMRAAGCSKGQTSHPPALGAPCPKQGRSAGRPEADPLEYNEDLNDAKTLHGKRRVTAHRGWAGERSDFFSSLLGFFLSIIEGR